MAKILVAADGKWVRDQVRAAFQASDIEIVEANRGQDVRDLVRDEKPAFAVVDMQIGNMGGIAVSIDLHLEASAGRVPHVPILLLLDREADKFLAKRADVDAVLVKPLDAGTLRRTAKRLLGATAAV